MSYRLGCLLHGNEQGAWCGLSGSSATTPARRRPNLKSQTLASEVRTVCQTRKWPIRTRRRTWRFPHILPHRPRPAAGRHRRAAGGTTCSGLRRNHPAAPARAPRGPRRLTHRRAIWGPPPPHAAPGRGARRSSDRCESEGGRRVTPVRPPVPTAPVSCRAHHLLPISRSESGAARPGTPVPWWRGGAVHHARPPVALGAQDEGACLRAGRRNAPRFAMPRPAHAAVPMAPPPPSPAPGRIKV